MKLDHLVIVVTGASQGLGKAIAREFVSEGAHIALCARDEKLINAVAAELKGLANADQIIIAATCDVSFEEEVERFFHEVQSCLGPVKKYLLFRGQDTRTRCDAYRRLAIQNSVRSRISWR